MQLFIRPFPVSLLLLVALLLLLAGGVESIVPCYCNNGNIDEEAPQCTCACFEGFLQPRCRYTADDTVRMELYTNIHSDTFSSLALQQTLVWSLGASSSSSSSDIVFEWATPLDSLNQTIAYYSMKGVQAQQLLWDFYSNNPWLAKAEITSVWEDIPIAGPMDIPLSKGVLYRDAKGNVVSVDHLSWLFGAVVVVVVASIMEKCCLSNSYEYPEEEEGGEEEEGEAAAAAKRGNQPKEDQPAVRAQQVNFTDDGRRNTTITATASSSGGRPPTPGGRNPLAAQQALAAAMDATPTRQHQAQADLCTRSRM